MVLSLIAYWSISPMITRSVKGILEYFVCFVLADKVGRYLNLFLGPLHHLFLSYHLHWVIFPGYLFCWNKLKHVVFVAVDHCGVVLFFAWLELKTYTFAGILFVTFCGHLWLNLRVSMKSHIVFILVHPFSFLLTETSVPTAFKLSLMAFLNLFLH